MDNCSVRLADVFKSSDLVVYDLSGKFLRHENKFSSTGSERRLAGFVAPSFGELPKWHVRPRWLVNPATGNRLELDLLFPLASVAFEFNGLLHRVQEQRARDAVKAWCCWQNGIALVVVRSFELSTSPFFWSRERYFRRRIIAATRRLADHKYGEGLKKNFVRALGVLTGDIREDLLPVGTLE